MAVPIYIIVNYSQTCYIGTCLFTYVLYIYDLTHNQQDNECFINLWSPKNYFSKKLISQKIFLLNTIL